MAVTTSSPVIAPVDAFQKTETQHVEDTNDADVEMTMEDSATNGLSQSKPADDRKMWGHVPEQPREPKPKRKFAPQPIETSTRSSKQEEAPKRSTSPKRKFAAEPVETTSRSSKSDNAKEDDKASRPRRKFAVEPIDAKATSSKDRTKKTEESDSKPKRRFAPEPMETSTRSSKDKEKDDKPTKPRRKFAVEQIETSSSSSRRKKEDSSDGRDSNIDFPSRSSSGTRKFSPELIQTAKASFRKKPMTPTRLLTPEPEEQEASWSAPEPTESRFSAANLARKARADPRRHSYSIPDLPIIQSDSSGEESSAPVTPGGIPAHEKVAHDWHARPKHHHQHPNAAHIAQMKTLRQQAVAAYGDQEDIVPFAHYGGDSEDEDYSTHAGELSIQGDADPSLFRRMSNSDLHLVVEDLRSHHEQLDRAKRELQEDTAGASRFSAAALAARHHLGIHHPTSRLESIREDEKREEAKKEDPEFAQMRKAASPPMQGNGIKFPFSISPKMTRCDPDQAPRPRRRNSEEDEDYDIGSDELWSAHVSVSKSPASVGLWGGLCQKDENAPVRPVTPLRSGLQTPAYESSNPFESRTPGRGNKTPGGARTPGTKTPGRGGGALWGGGSAFMPLTPPRSRNDKPIDTFAVALDAKLTLERQIDTEFHPRVITQIYNYLSLGYPPLARPFDEELSKISRISIAELRKGDRSQTGTMKGHIGVPEGEGEGEEDDEGRVKGCRRWEALRLYVREWARQSPNFVDEQSLKNVGTGMWGNNAPVRKGSWGF